MNLPPVCRPVSGNPFVSCPDCPWRAEVDALEDDALVRAATLLEEHLGLVHDVTWARAWEYASEWLKRTAGRDVSEQ